jgi:uncharacterized protein (TIGR03435 family)
MKVPVLVAMVVASALGLSPSGSRLLALATPLAAQSPADRLAFEAATVKRNVSSDVEPQAQSLPGGRVQLTNVTLRNMILDSYKLQNAQVDGGPSWVQTDGWDVTAKAPADAPSAQVLEMLRTLLTDRFKLVTHTEAREMPVYALVLSRKDGKLGANLKPSDADCGATAAPPPASGPPRCGMNIGINRITVGARSLKDIARVLEPRVGRSVIDKTGLSGLFDADLTWTPQGLAGASAAAEEGTSIFTAVQEQLGLKLESTKGPVDVLVIDHVEQPAQD